MKLEDTLYPLEKRREMVAKDGRPFWREYFPGCVDTGRMDKAGFVSSATEIEDYLSYRQSHPIFIYFEKNKAYKPECFTMSLWFALDKDGKVERTRELVLGFGQNIPEEWFKEYNKERCKKNMLKIKQEEWKAKKEEKV